MLLTCTNGRMKAAPESAPTLIRGLTHHLLSQEGGLAVKATRIAAASMSEADINRFWSKVRKTATCWEWTAGLSKGYGVFGVSRGGERATFRAHRVSWLLTGNSDVPSLVLDHACRNRACVNPAHLRPMPNAENVLIGIGPTAINKRKTHCQRGHEFTPENTIPRPNGWRACRECRRADKRAARRRRATPEQRPSMAGVRVVCPTCAAKIAPASLRRHVRRMHAARAGQIGDDRG